MNGAHVVLERSGPERPWVGQLVKLDVQLWRPVVEEGKAAPFSYGEPLVVGALAHFREEAPPPDEREQGGQKWLVQHRTLLVFPQMDGVLSIPPITARWNHGAEVEVARSEPLEISAALPPRGDERLVVAPRLSIEQTIDRALVGLRVSDGFTRTIVVSADDSDPLVLPTLEFVPVSGLSVYPAAPDDASSAERGQLSAARTFSATYVVDRVGHYELPALSVEWLEPGSGHYAVAVAPEVDFWARPNVHLGLSMWGTSTLAGWIGFGLLAATLVFTALLARRRARSGPFTWERWLNGRLAERRAFRGALRSTKRGPAREALRSLYAWLRIRLPDSPRTFEPLRAADEGVAQGLAATERLAFAVQASAIATSDWSRSLRRARRRLAKRSMPGVSLNRHG